MGKLVAFLLVAVLLQITWARFPNLKKKPFIQKPLNNLGDPLILTSYIEQGRIQDAKSDAEVHLPAFQNVTSYAGYLNVDKENNGNLFFWFFPSENNYAEDPVLLWLQGGPGGSSLFGLFVEHGPFTIDDNGNVLLRDYSWHKNHSVLYIDQPVGTGFSFTDGDFVTDQYQVADHLYSGLTQFFTLFPEVQKNDFFISGESYAGKYIPSIGYAIHQRNPNASVKINLQGLLIGNGLSDPINQFNYGDFLYQLGLIDLPQLDIFNREEADIVSAINNQNYLIATDLWNELLGTDFTIYCALDNVYNFLKDFDDSPTAWQDFVVQDDVRKALHVGSQTYSWENYEVYYGLYGDITVSVAPWVVELLNHYRVLIFNGQLDIIVGYPLTANYLQKLNFSAAEEYKTAQRNIWSVGERVAGYAKTAGNLTEVLVRDAGHMVASDQPEFAYDLIYRFIRNQPLKPLNNLGGPLILTSYIEEGRIQDAKSDAEVHLPAFQNITSYTGFFNVDKENNGNLFFWFFPSKDNYAKDPVLLWLQGGPGASSLLGLFNEHGPFTVNDEGTVLLRNYSWHKNHSVLYIEHFTSATANDFKESS